MTYSDWWVNTLNIRLFDQYFASFGAKDLNFVLFDDLASLQLFDLTIKITVIAHSGEFFSALLALARVLCEMKMFFLEKRFSRLAGQSSKYRILAYGWELSSELIDVEMSFADIQKTIIFDDVLSEFMQRISLSCTKMERVVEIDNWKVFGTF